MAGHDTVNMAAPPSKAEYIAIDGAAPRPTLLGLRRSALIEMALFLGLALSLDAALFDGTRYADVSPHPFWLLVVLISVQYGVNEGILAATLSSAALLIGALPERSFGQDIYAYVGGMAAEPVLWLMAAVLIGEVRTRQIRERDAVEAELADQKREAAVIADAYAKAQTIRATLEQRLASEVRTTLTLYEGARAIEKTSLGEVLLGVGELVKATLGPEKFSVYILNANALEAAFNEGWEPHDRFTAFFGPETRLFEAVVGRQSALAITRAEDREILGSEGVVAAPLRSSEDGAVVGMLKIEGMPFLDLNVTTIETIRRLAEWIGTAIERATRHERLARERLSTDVPEVMSASLLDHQRRFLADLGRRLGFESTMIRIFTDHTHLVPTDDRAAIADAIGIGVSRALRSTDLAFEHGRHGRNYAVILAGTAPDKADTVIDKLRHEITLALPDDLSGIGLRFTATPCDGR